MIGLDTKVLLRLWLNDDPGQNKRLDALLAQHGSAVESLLVTDVVLAEAVWTLQSAYAQGKPAQLAALLSLLQEPAFAFEDRGAVVQAVAAFESASCGFSDCLVAAKHRSHGCEFTATFDRGMRKLAGVRLI
jgi:predicted nucleic-acid-binding protein